MKKICFFTLIILILGINLGFTYNFLGNYIPPYEEVNSDVIFNVEGGEKVKITVCQENLIKVWMEPSGTFERDPSYIVIKDTWPVEFNVIDNGNCLNITTDKLIVRVNKSPFRLSFYTIDDSLIAKERDEGGIGCEGNNICEFMDLSFEEHFWGLGESIDRPGGGKIDYRGEQTLMKTDHSCCGTGSGVHCLPVPFFLTNGRENKGYGMFFDNTHYATFDLGKDSNDYYYYSSPGGELIFYFIYGPQLKDVLDRYTDLTGKPPLPLAWTLGHFQSGCWWGESWNDLVNRMNNWTSMYRTRNIPCDSFIWDFSWVNCKFDLQFAGANGPEVLTNLQAENIKIVPIIDPMVQDSCSNYNEGVSNNYFCKDGEGNIKTCGWFNGALIDFTNPQARNWWWNLSKHLYTDGIAGYWFDLNEPESCDDNTYYFDGSALECRNVEALQMCKTYFEGQKNDFPNQRIFSLSRSGFAGMQRYGAAVWSGDVPMHIWYDFSRQFFCAINTGLSGIPYWTFDAGEAGSSAEAYIRHLQFASFCPLSRIHGGQVKTPWEYGTSTEEICRKYLKLRYRLFPYRYTYSYQAKQKGLPILRGLVLEYQDDVETYNLEDEYLFGKEILVAPVYTEGATSRQIYLPQGNWIDYWSGQKYSGKQRIEYEAPLEKLPLLIKEGAIIPFGPQIYWIEEGETFSPLTWDIYPATFTTHFTLYEDDGLTYDYEAGEYNLIKVEFQPQSEELSLINITTEEDGYDLGEREFYFKVRDMSHAGSVYLDDEELEEYASEQDLIEQQKGWSYEEGVILVKIPFNLGNHQLNLNFPPGPQKINLSSEKEALIADGEDSTLIMAKVVDRNGDVVDWVEGKISFEITGEGVLIGEQEVELSSGIAEIGMKSTLTPGEIEIIANWQDLRGKKTINSVGSGTELKLFKERDLILANGEDEVLLLVKILDARGQVVKINNSKVYFTLKGEGQLSEQSVEIKDGEAEVYLKSFSEGEIKVQAIIPGLSGDNVDINAVKGEISYSIVPSLRIIYLPSIEPTPADPPSSFKVETEIKQGTTTIEGKGKIKVEVIGPQARELEQEFIAGRTTFEEISLSLPGEYRVIIGGDGLISVQDNIKVKVAHISGGLIEKDEVKLSISRNTLNKDAIINIVEYKDLDLSDKERIELANSKLSQAEGEKTEINSHLFQNYSYKVEAIDEEDVLLGGSKLFIKYKDKENDGIIDGTNINEDNLRIFYLAQDDNLWEKKGYTYLSPNNNEIMLQLNETGIYSLFGVRPEGEFGISGLTNYPNPFADETRFIFDLGCSADVKIRIYTIKGRLIKEIKYSGDPGYNEILWDGKDEKEKEVANGVYLYKIIVGGIEKIGKIAKIRGGD